MELLEEGWRSLKLLRNATGIRAFSASPASVLLQPTASLSFLNSSQMSSKEMRIQSSDLQATRRDTVKLEVLQDAIVEAKCTVGSFQASDM